MIETNTSHCGFVALFGFSNVGKSTLMNRLIGKKISIVTHKVQTTRIPIRGITSYKNSQIIFVDTPGLFLNSGGKAEKSILSIAVEETSKADHVLVIVDAEKGLQGAKKIWAYLDTINKPKSLVLNKIDRIKRETLLSLSYDLNQRAVFDRTFMISALKGSGCRDLLERLSQILPEGPWLYPEDQVLDSSLTEVCTEITREKIYLRVHQELPYSCFVKTVSWKEKADKSIKIEQEIKVARPSHKKILIGKSGSTLRDIGQTARYAMQEFFGKKVHLFLFVRVGKEEKENSSSL